MKKSTKHPEDMDSAELAEATKQFDRPFIFEKARPMTLAERRQERKLRRGRPKLGEGARKISISLEGGLLKKADAMARKEGIKRSELIAGFVAAGLQGRPI